MNKLIVPEDTNVIALNPEPDLPSTDEDWLWKLPIGSVFVLGQRPQQMKDRYNQVHVVLDHNLGEYHVVDRDLEGDRRMVKLLQNLNEEHYSWVDSPVFSNNFILFKVRYYGTKG